MLFFCTFDWDAEKHSRMQLLFWKQREFRPSHFHTFKHSVHILVPLLQKTWREQIRFDQLITDREECVFHLQNKDCWICLSRVCFLCMWKTCSNSHTGLVFKRTELEWSELHTFPWATREENIWEPLNKCYIFFKQHHIFLEIFQQLKN